MWRFSTHRSADVDRGVLADLSTRFYTLVPHDFGERAPPLIDDAETVNKKMKLLEALIDIGIAAEASEAAEKANDPVVAQYAISSDTKTARQLLISRVVC